MEERIRAARTERESDRRREEKWQTCWCCRDQQRACRMAQASAEKFEHTGPAEKERVASVPQREQLESTPEQPLPKRKGTDPSVQSTRSRGGRKSRWARAAPWREREIRARVWSGKGGLQDERRQTPRRKGRASKKSLPRTSRRKHERVSGRKSSPGRSAESWFHSKSGQT